MANQTIAQRIISEMHLVELLPACREEAKHSHHELLANQNYRNVYTHIFHDGSMIVHDNNNILFSI